MINLPRFSACAQHSHKQELARLKAMTVEDRIRRALELKNTFAWLKPASLKAKDQL